MNCKNCRREISEHEKFYIFECEQYYPGGGTSDLTLISSDMNERKGGDWTFNEVLYACGDTIYGAEDGEEITPGVMR